MRARDLQPGDRHTVRLPWAPHHHTIEVAEPPEIHEDSAEVRVLVRYSDGGTGYRVFPDTEAQVPYIRPQTAQEGS